MRAPIVSAVVAAVLGVACTGDPAPPERSETPTGPHRCEERPGVIPEGFILRRTREFPEPDRVAIREEYRDPDGRLLVYLLGVTGEVGEGLPVADDLVIASGEPATLLGREANWVLRWEGDPPCSPSSIVGNGFDRDGFVGLLEDAEVLGG